MRLKQYFLNNVIFLITTPHNSASEYYSIQSFAFRLTCRRGRCCQWPLNPFSLFLSNFFLLTIKVIVYCYSAAVAAIAAIATWSSRIFLPVCHQLTKADVIYGHRLSVVCSFISRPCSFVFVLCHTLNKFAKQFIFRGQKSYRLLYPYRTLGQPNGNCRVKFGYILETKYWCLVEWEPTIHVIYKLWVTFGNNIK